MMKPEAASKLEGMSWDWREATLDLLAIARSEQMPFTTSRPIAIIRSHGFAVSSSDRNVLTDAGLSYLRRTFA